MSRSASLALGARLLRVPERVALLLGRRGRLRARLDPRHPRRGARARRRQDDRRSARSSTRPPTGSARRSCSARSRLVFARDGNEIGARVHVRRARRLVPRLVHAREGRGARPEGRRRHRLAGRARRGDHAGLVLAPWGGLQWAIYLLAATAWITVVPADLVGRGSCSARLALPRYTASTSVLAPRRKSVFVRMPAALKRRLADEAKATRTQLQRRRGRPPRRRLRGAVRAERPGRLPTPRGRIGAAAHAARAEGPARPARGRTPAERERAHRRDALRAARLHRKGIHGFQQRKVERQDAVERQGPRRDHRRRQLRELAAPGRAVLQRREPGRLRPRPDARRPRRVSHQRHRVRRRLRRRQGEGRQSTSPTRSGRTRTTRSSSPTSRRRASPSTAG